ncbi:MAG: hypothetical protein WC119_01365 [Synergistaceae bacterium]
MNKKDKRYIVRCAKKLKIIEVKGGKCQGCGNENPFVLDFHHIDGHSKDKEISLLIEGRWSELEKEAEKCELLCRNCHNECHEEIDRQGNDLRVRELKKELMRLSGLKGCKICGYDKCSYSLDFHHNSDKSFVITNEISRGKCLTEKIFEEIEKCDLLCKNCHKMLHLDIERYKRFESLILEKMENLIELPATYKNEILRLKKEGKKQFQVANELGCARSTVHRFWHQ